MPQLARTRSVGVLAGVSVRVLVRVPSGESLGRSFGELIALVRGAATLGALLAVAAPALAGSLQPTHAALVRQSLSAREAGFTYIDKDEQVHDLVRRGLLVAMRGNADYYIHPDVRHAAARPETKVFVERLARQYGDTCGERLVVTSLVRPRSRQPWNSDPLSVHPTGMAVDLRISSSSACRRWLEDVLLDLENDGWIEAARERVVPHYHVVVFPAYSQHLERHGVEVPATPVAVLASSSESGLASLMGAFSSAGLPAVAATTGLPAPRSAPALRRSPSDRSSGTVTKKRITSRRAASSQRASSRRYKVRRGDNLWSIARRHGITVAAIRRANRVPKLLKPGQVLAIPAR